MFPPWLPARTPNVRHGHLQPSDEQIAQAVWLHLKLASTRHRCNHGPSTQKPIATSNGEVGRSGVEQEDPMMLGLVGDSASHDGLHTLINKIRQLAHRLVGLPMVVCAAADAGVVRGNQGSVFLRKLQHARKWSHFTIYLPEIFVVNTRELPQCHLV